MIFCSQCGTQLSDDSSFCTACGAKVVLPIEDGPIDFDMQDAETNTDSVESQDSDGITGGSESFSGDASEADRAVSSLDLDDTQAMPSGVADSAVTGASAFDADATQVLNDQPAYDGSSDPTRIISPVDYQGDSDYTRVLPNQNTTQRIPAQTNMQDVSGTPYEQQTQKKGPSKKAIIITVVVIVVVAALGVGGFFAWRYFDEQQQIQEEYDLARTSMEVIVPITAEGLDTSTGSKIPIKIVGTNLDGEAISPDLYYVDEEGSSLYLPTGEYDLYIPASPIASDGTIYDVSDQEVHVSVDTVEGSYYFYGTFVLEPIEASDVTDEEIELAYEYALSGGVDSEDQASNLRAVARNRAEIAQSSTSNSSNSLHITADSYEITFPSYWRDRVEITVSGDEITVVSAEYPTRAICSVYVADLDDPTFTMGDIGNSVVGTYQLSNGLSVVVWVDRYAYLIPMALYTNSTDSELYFTRAEADELIDLQTGGEYDYQDILDHFDSETMSGTLTFSVDDYFESAILPNITER